MGPDPDPQQCGQNPRMPHLDHSVPVEHVEDSVLLVQGLVLPERQKKTVLATRVGEPFSVRHGFLQLRQYSSKVCLLLSWKTQNK